MTGKVANIYASRYFACKRPIPGKMGQKQPKTTRKDIHNLYSVNMAFVMGQFLQDFCISGAAWRSW